MVKKKKKTSKLTLVLSSLVILLTILLIISNWSRLTCLSHQLQYRLDPQKSPEYMENLLKETIQVKVRDMVDKEPETWEKIQYMSKQITIYFKPGISVKRIYEINDLLIATNKIEDIVYISQQDAYDIFSEENKDSPELTELLTPDILPASLEIYVKENDDVEYIKEFIEKFQEDIETTVYGNESYEGIKDIMEGNFKLN